MGSFTGYLVVYVLGGITFIPLLLVLIFLHALLTFPQRNQYFEEPTDSILSEKEKERKKYTSPIQRPTDDQFSLKSTTDRLAEKFQRTHESDVASGYFAVWREYFPGGFKNVRPPERTNSAAASETVSLGYDFRNLPQCLSEHVPEYLRSEADTFDRASKE
jgi:hypothetical protein